MRASRRHQKAYGGVRKPTRRQARCGARVRSIRSNQKQSLTGANVEAIAKDDEGSGQQQAPCRRATQRERRILLFAVETGSATGRSRRRARVGCDLASGRSTAALVLRVQALAEGCAHAGQPVSQHTQRACEQQLQDGTRLEAAHLVESTAEEGANQKQSAAIRSNQQQSAAAHLVESAAEEGAGRVPERRSKGNQPEAALASAGVDAAPAIA